MDQLIKDLYSDSILQEALLRYGGTFQQPQELKAFESFIYEFERDSQSYILRVSHSLRRSEYLIEGEVDWINYLAEGGVSVARAISSDNGKRVEAIDDSHGGCFLATAFVKAKGISPWDIWSPELYETYGELIGKIHALSKQYSPKGPEWRRPEWDHDMMNFVDHYLPESESVVKKKYAVLRDHLRKLPKDESCYGLIHQDAHGNNFLVDETGQITLFDFDECAYSWFINEIAIVLFYIIMDAEDWPVFTQDFMSHFLRGYAKANPMEAKWLKEIPNFLKLREMELYAVAHRDFDVNNIDDWWMARFMQHRKHKIENDVAFIDFDFESLSLFL
jgi:amicoumacin kinase